MKASLFSVSYAGLWGQATLRLPEFVARAGQLGFSSVMLMGKRPHLSPLDATPGFMKTLRQALDDARVQCDVIAAYTHLAPSAAAEVPAIEMQVSYVESLCRIGAELGASIIRVFTAYTPEGQDLQASWTRAVTTIREMCDRAAPHGLTVAIQNHHDLALHTDALLELLADVDRPNCKLGFDAWSPALRGEDLVEAARKAAPHTVLTTNGDYIRVPRYRYQPALVNYERQTPDWVRAVPFGTGFIDYGKFFRALREGGFDGVAAYEMCSPLRGGGQVDNLDQCAKGYVAWMRDNQFLV